MKKKNIRFVKLGKVGADKRWAPRHQKIFELSKYISKERLNYMQEQPTKTIEVVLASLIERKKQLRKLK